MKAYDNNVNKKDFDLLGIKKINTIEKSFENSDFVIILNNNPSFKKMNISALSRLMKSNGLIYDYWGNFDKTSIKLNNKVKYISYGGHQVR